MLPQPLGHAMWASAVRERPDLFEQPGLDLIREQTVEALEYLFLSIATNADPDYRLRALRRAEIALEAAMPGWNSPVPPIRMELSNATRSTPNVLR